MPSALGCTDCRFWAGRLSTDSLDGQCRRFPPVPFKDDGLLIWDWPITDKQDICGEWRFRLDTSTPPA